MLRLPQFDFLHARSLEEAASALAGEGAGEGLVRLVAGGTDLWPNMKRRHQQATTVVSLMGIPGLAGIDVNGEIRIGATTLLSDVVAHPAVRERYPGFATAVQSISSPPLRNMGTIGGNLCVDTRCTYYNQTEEWRRSIDYCMKAEGEICWVATSSPRCWAHTATDSAPMACALGATVKLDSKDGERVIPIDDFYKDGDDPTLPGLDLAGGDPIVDWDDPASWNHEAAVGAVVELTPLGRLGEVADMADAVVFLASDGARFITGAGLPVDGGMGM